MKAQEKENHLKELKINFEYVFLNRTPRYDK